MGKINLQNKTTMKKLSLILLTLLMPLCLFSQVTKSNEWFEKIYTLDGKVVFIKEIKPQTNNEGQNYKLLKEWGRANFAKDPFNSSINYDDKNHKITARSRIELLFPENAKGVKESIIMKYRLDAFFVGDLCVVEITSISYINNPKANGNTLPQKIKAEDLVTDSALLLEDSNTTTRINARKSTLFFFNDLLNSLQNVLTTH